jgi:hypothetical protein
MMLRVNAMEPAPLRWGERAENEMRQHRTTSALRFHASEDIVHLLEGG